MKTVTGVRTHRLLAGPLAAAFRPEQGMLGISLTHHGEELLTGVDDLDGAAAAGRAVGIPLLHPWANRLRGTRYAAAGRTVVLDPASPWLLTDWNGVIIHGVPWSRLAWQTVDASTTRLSGRLAWNAPPLLAVFPFPHHLELTAALDACGLTLTTTLHASGGVRVPASFGFHPYLTLPGLPRARWRLRLPPLQRRVLDPLLIPTGAMEDLAASDAPLAERAFDDGYSFTTEQPVMSIAGGGRRIAVEFGSGYRHAQVYAPTDRDLISLEPMVAPTNALVTGEQLPVVAPGGRYTAVFRIAVDETR